MTIHSDWARILHEECPQAFSLTKPPNACAARSGSSSSARSGKQQSCFYQVGIIDGHLQLMRLDARMQTWDCFIRNQFIKPIQEMFAYGCPRVVLCFDDYAGVPLYKAMTQNSRANKFEVKTFGPHEELPPMIPDEPILYLMNRNFKLKLIDMLCRRIPQMLKVLSFQEFILDYKMVVQYAAHTPAIPVLGTTGNDHNDRDKGHADDDDDDRDVDRDRKQQQHPLIPSPILMKDMSNMGESDVKFIRYVKKFGNALVHAIDGDYMAIALLYYAANDIQKTNKIFIYRQLSYLHQQSLPPPTTAGSASNGPSKTKSGDGGAPTTMTPQRKTKRKRVVHERRDSCDADPLDREEEEEEEDTDPSSHCSSSDAPNKKKTATAKKKCWVDMQLIYVSLVHAMRQCGYTQAINAKTLEPFSDKDAVFTAIFLMLCAGTDFSRNIPLIGPKKIWDYLPDIALPAMQALRGGDCVNESMLLNMVVGKLYGLAYSKHCSSVMLHTAPQGFFERVIRALKDSKLSQGTKDRFLTTARIQNTIKNLIWVTKYWMTDNGKVETPLNGEYGFAQDDQGKMNFKDLISVMSMAPPLSSATSGGMDSASG